MSGVNMKNLYYDRIFPYQKHIPKTQEYEDTLELFSVAEGELREQMTAKEEAMFIDYRSYVERLSMLQNEECFVQGMSLGIQLMAEAFVQDAGKSE